MHKRILIVTPGFFPLFGGMEQECYLLAKEYLRRGVVVDILTEQTEIGFPRQEIYEGINVYRLRHIKQRNICGFISLFGELVWFFLKNGGKYNFAIIRTLTFHCLVIGLLKYLRLTKIKTVITAETGGDHDDVIALKTRWFTAILVNIFGQHDYLNSICGDNYRHYLALGFDKKKLTRIYNGIETEGYQQRNYPEKVLTFLFIGRLRKTKGVYELLEAFVQLNKINPKTRLIIGGEGEEKEGMMNFIKNNNLDKVVTYWGYVTKDDKEKFFMSGDCAVLPSYSEGLPTTVLEATIYKRYNICTLVSDLEQLYGNNIIFVKMKDSDDLYKKMLDLAMNFDKMRPNYDEMVSKIDIKKVSNSFWRLFFDFDI